MTVMSIGQLTLLDGVNPRHGCTRDQRSATIHFRQSLVGINAHVIDLHLGWEWRRRVRRARPIAADRQVENDETALPRVERPYRASDARLSKTCGSEGDVRRCGIIDVIGYASLRPDHAIGVPLRCVLASREIILLAQSRASGESGPVNRSGIPIGIQGCVDPLEHIHFAAGGP